MSLRTSVQNLPEVIAHAGAQVGAAAERLRALATGDRSDALQAIAGSLDGVRDGLAGAHAQLTRQNAELDRWAADLEERVAERTAALERANAELAAIATLDALTGLPNHRVLVIALERELARSRRYGHPMSLLFIDIDHFKALNDTLGHGAGDSALHDVGAIMRSVLRPADTVGRWGGEEFLVILPETAAADAVALAERLRATIAAHGFLEGRSTRLTVSIGVATFPADGASRRTLTEAADRAMYAAKRLGRNRVFAASDDATDAAAAAVDAAEPRDGGVAAAAVEAITAIVGMRDDSAVAHMDDVSCLAVRLAVDLGLAPAEARIVGIAGALHDVGKVTVPDSILLKPGPLTEAEWEVMHSHTAAGGEVLQRVRVLRDAAPLVRGHHERFDGTGYPDRLAGTAIPLGARIVAVADAFAAMTAERSYARACRCEVALAEIRRGAGSQFDPEVVAALERVLASDGGQALVGDAA